MKKQLKLQHQQPSRRSGRRSSVASTSSSPSIRKASPGPESRPADAWALSLHVVDQQPLSTCFPSPEEDNSVRRSSRFTAKKYKNPPPELRKSPRMAYSSADPVSTSTVGEDVGLVEAVPEKRRLSADKAAAGSLSWGEKGNSGHQLLALPEPGSGPGSRGCVSERCLRSRTVLMSVGDGGGFKIGERRLRSRVVRYAVAESPAALQKSAVRSYALIEFPKIDGNVGEIPKFEKLPWHEKSPISGEKCLRSRSVNMLLKEETDASVTGSSSVRLSKKKRSVTPKKEASLGKLPDVLEKRVGQSERQLKEERVASVTGSSSVRLNKKKRLVTPKKESSLGKLLDVLEKREGQSERQLKEERAASVTGSSSVRLNKKKRLATSKKESSLGKLTDVLEKKEVQSERRLRSRKFRV